MEEAQMDKVDSGHTGIDFADSLSVQVIQVYMELADMDQPNSDLFSGKY